MTLLLYYSNICRKQTGFIFCCTVGAVESVLVVRGRFIDTCNKPWSKESSSSPDATAAAAAETSVCASQSASKHQRRQTHRAAPKPGTTWTSKTCLTIALVIVSLDKRPLMILTLADQRDFFSDIWCVGDILYLVSNPFPIKIFPVPRPIMTIQCSE